MHAKVRQHKKGIKNASATNTPIMRKRLHYKKNHTRKTKTKNKKCTPTCCIHYYYYRLLKRGEGICQKRKLAGSSRRRRNRKRWQIFCFCLFLKRAKQNNLLTNIRKQNWKIKETQLIGRGRRWHMKNRSRGRCHHHSPADQKTRFCWNKTKKQTN